MATFSQSEHRKNFNQKYWDNYVGLYSNDQLIYSISLTWGNKLVLTNLTDGTIKLFKEKTNHIFSSSDSSKLIFNPLKNFSTELIHNDSSLTLTKRKIKMEALSIPVNDGQIAGTLILPDYKAPFPLIIVNGGASWIIRDTNLDEALFYTSRGIASFVYDKRGWGESTGNKTVSFSTSADDINRIADYLKFRMDINPSKIGISTYSQSGWYGTLASATSDIISYQILNVPSATFIYRQEEQRIKTELTVDGFDKLEIDSALHLFNCMSEFSTTGLGWDEYIEFRNKSRFEEWFKYLFAPDNKKRETWEWGRINWKYNPLPALLKNNIPTLVVLGENDKKVLPEVNRSIFELIFETSGNRDYEIVIIKNMNHSLMLSEKGGRKENLSLQQPPELFESRSKWIQKYVTN
jgi:pimeloyl-ACP methyl ester carboxylesterase